MQAEHLTDPNVERIFRDIAKTNKSIKEDIQAGITTTLTLYNNKGFKSYTVNESSIIKIKDEHISAKALKTQTRAFHGDMSFNAGNWYSSYIEFSVRPEQAQTGKFSLLTAVETLLEESKGTGGQQLAVKHPSHGNSKVMVRLEEKPMEPLNLVTPIKIKNEQRGEPAYHRNKRVYFLV